MVEEKTPKISIEKIEDVLDFVSEDLSKILLLLNKHNLIPRDKLKRTFENKKDLNSFFENLIIDYLNDKYLEIYKRLSDVRKKGTDLTELGLKLSQFKFKLKLLKVNFDTNSFSKVILILDEVKKELDDYDISDEKARKEKAKEENKTKKVKETSSETNKTEKTKE